LFGLKTCELGTCFAGRMRCLAALARWEELSDLCKEYWTPADAVTRLEIAPMVGFILWFMYDGHFLLAVIGLLLFGLGC